MLSLKDIPEWQTICGGSNTYVNAFANAFRGKIFTSTLVKKIERSEKQVAVTLQNEVKELFDFAVLATHADTSLSLLSKPTAEERALLGSWRYKPNRAMLHTDISLLPKERRYWAAWNYSRSTQGSLAQDLSITYCMNILQNLNSPTDYLVTLNDQGAIDSTKVLYDILYSHPIYTHASVASQAGLKKINGTLNTFYCGAYMRYGFHEDGFVSGKDVAEQIAGLFR
jgi:hypothetical protein